MLQREGTCISGEVDMCGRKVRLEARCRIPGCMDWIGSTACRGKSIRSCQDVGHDRLIFFAQALNHCGQLATWTVSCNIVRTRAQRSHKSIGDYTCCIASTTKSCSHVVNQPIRTTSGAVRLHSIGSLDRRSDTFQEGADPSGNRCGSRIDRLPVRHWR